METLHASLCQDVNRARARRERAPREPPIGVHHAGATVRWGTTATHTSPPHPTSLHIVKSSTASATITRAAPWPRLALGPNLAPSPPRTDEGDRR
jgi:hypothetical protein